jgi:thiol-disulfide isomerase/thioredoxin
MLKKIAFVIICSHVGLLFLFSGYSKLHPIEPFEYTFVDLGIVNWQLTPFVARVLIGLEFFIGVLFLFNIFLRKIAYKLGIIVLSLFSIYLVAIIIFKGNTGNCGCFGTMLEMTPLQALIKNIALLLVITILYKLHDGWVMNKLKLVTSIVIGSASIATPFILNPVELDYSEAYLNKPEENFKLELDTLYANAQIYTPPKTLSKGKHIIAFMSLTCPHCKIAAKKIGIIHKRNPFISFYFVLNGDEKNLNSFFEESNAGNIPYCMLRGKPFMYLAGTSFPSIYMLNNGIVEHEINYMNMDQDEIEKWFNSQ